MENCLAHDLRHARARRALAILDGVLKTDEIVDPDHLPLPPEGLRAADAQRFMCPKCGGRMSFSPDLAAYAAFDLTGLALLKEFPVSAALVDLAWGAFLSAAVSAVIVLSARAWS